jgi:general stress protein 26
MADSELNSIVRRFAESKYSWLSTVRPDGRAHASPIWHVWYHGRIYLVTMSVAVKVHNIQDNPSVVITHPDAKKAIIVEGEARLVTDMTDALRPYFKSKYDWDIVTDEDYRTVIEINPTKLLAWGEEGASHRKRWRGEEVSAVTHDALES